jgi:hypothetical protein
MPGTFNCPACGAPLEYPGVGETVPCPYCRNSVIVPQELRSHAPEGAAARKAAAHTAAGADQTVPGLTPEQLAQVKRYLHDGQKIEAIKVYRQATSVGLKEAKDAVEAIAAGDPELKMNPQTAKSTGATIGSRIVGILVSLFFLGIASIFPLVFFPMGMDAWQVHEFAGAIVAFVGAIIWAVIWGGIGVVLLFARV